MPGSKIRKENKTPKTTKRREEKKGSPVTDGPLRGGESKRKGHE